MSQVVYLDRFRILEGKLEDFKRFANDMAEFVEKNEPRVISFNYYLDEDGNEGTAVFVFSDAEAVDLHLDLASSRLHEGVELLGATDIELLGRPSDLAREMAESFGAKVRTQLLAGFSRYQAHQEIP